MRVTIVASLLALGLAGCGDDSGQPDAAPDLSVRDGGTRDLTENADLTPNLDLANLDLTPGPDLAPPRFMPQTSGTTDFLGAVYGFGANVYVVGGLTDTNGVTQHGTILHSTDSGAHWTSETVPVTAFLYAVWGPAANDVYVVGEGGNILHSTGNGVWTAGTSGTTNALTGIWGSSANDIYAVGEGGLILRSTNGTAWTPQTSGTTNLLFWVWGSGANDVYAVGNMGTILHTANMGTTWTPQTSGSTLTLTSVFGTSATNVYVVGDQGLILHSTGNGTWAGQTSNVTTFLSSVTGTGSDIWVVGSMATILNSNPGVKGGAFQPVASSQYGNYYGVWGTSANDVFIVGEGGLILH